MYLHSPAYLLKNPINFSNMQIEIQHQFLSQFNKFIEGRSSKENTPVNAHESFEWEVVDGLAQIAKRDIKYIICKARLTDIGKPCYDSNFLLH